MRSLRQFAADQKLFVTHPAFLGILAAKVISSALFASHYLRQLFVPFVAYFVDSGFRNPWDAFYQTGAFDAFPYSLGMLGALTVPAALTVPFFGHFASAPEPIRWLALRLPLLVADVGIYLTLCHLLELRWKKVLLLYWASPVLFYISYVHGQLDAIPTALLMLSLWFAIRLSPVKAGAALGLGLSTKFHLAAAVPIVAFYLWRREVPAKRVRACARFAVALLIPVLLLIAPLLSSVGFRMLVLGAKETGWVYSLGWKMPQGMTLLLCPLVVMLLVLHFFSYSRMTKDALILYIGLIYAALLLLVPPMPGWAYWSVPFLCYFCVRHDAVRFAPFWLYTGLYCLFYGALAPGIAPDRLAQAIAATFPRSADLVFTAMQASLFLVAAWIYKVGVRTYIRYKASLSIRSIGIGGDSASGKHTLAETLTALLGPANTIRLHGDDYHRWPREHPAWKERTHLDPQSNYFRQPIDHILELKSGNAIERTSYDHATGGFLPPEKVASNRFILFEGLHPFVFQRMRDAFDMKIFIATEEELRKRWKVERDTALRGYSADKVLAEMERRQDDSARFVRPQSQYADWIVEYFADAPDGPVGVRHRVSSAIVELERLVDALAEAKPQLSSAWAMEPDLRRQTLEIRGTISSERVAHIATKLFPDVVDFVGAEPEWRSDLQGMHQLVFLCVFYGLQPRP